MSDFNIQFEEQDQSITLEFEQIGGGAVKSVNGKTGVVVLTASDVGALPTSTLIPTVDNTLTTAGAAADAKKTGDEIATLKDGLSDLEASMTETINNVYVTDTASGAIASFPDGANDIPVKSLTVDIEPVQSGSGDPSPDNVRPISGHTQAVVTRCGKNLFDCDNPNLLGAYISISGVITATEVDKSAYIYIGKNRDYAISFTQIALSSAREPDDVQVGLFTSEPVIGLTGTRVYKVSRPTATGNFSFQYTGNSGDNEWLMLKVGNTSWSNVSASMETIQIELNSAVTEYNAYNSQTYTINLGGTRYGGTLDVGTGVLTVDRAFIASYNGETLPSTWISDRDVYAAGTTPTTGAQVCYKVATPQTIQLTANEVKTLLGQNNIWADTGDVEVEYRADTRLYIDKRINEAVSALS